MDPQENFTLPPLPPDEIPPGYQIPTYEQIQGLKIEVYILLAIYFVTILFVLHNIVRYLWL